MVQLCIDCKSHHKILKIPFIPWDWCSIECRCNDIHSWLQGLESKAMKSQHHLHTWLLYITRTIFELNLTSILLAKILTLWSSPSSTAVLWSIHTFKIFLLKMSNILSNLLIFGTWCRLCRGGVNGRGTFLLHLSFTRWQVSFWSHQIFPIMYCIGYLPLLFSRLSFSHA